MFIRFYRIYDLIPFTLLIYSFRRVSLHIRANIQGNFSPSIIVRECGLRSEGEQLFGETTNRNAGALPAFSSSWQVQSPACMQKPGNGQ